LNFNRLQAGGDILAIPFQDDLLLIGAGTGAACCGAISVGLLATILGATATMAARLARYETSLIALGYLLLGSSLLHQGYRLYQLLRAQPALAHHQETSVGMAGRSL